MEAKSFKLKRYNEGGFLDFLQNNPIQANAAFTGATNTIGGLTSPGENSSFGAFSSNYHNRNNRNNSINQGLNAASSVASTIPGIGTILAGGLQGAKLLSNLTKADEDQYGVHKSGLLSTFDPQDQLRKDRNRFQDQNILDTYSQEEQAGNQARAAIGGYKSAAYGKHGMKMKMKVSRFSKPYKK